MSRAAREAFLRDPRPAILSIPRQGKGPLSSPVWFDFDAGGDFWVLMQSDSRKGQGGYTLVWQRVIPVAHLAMTRPTTGDRWESGVERTIRWNYDRQNVQSFDVYLMKGAIMTGVIREDLAIATELRWIPETDLEPDDDYRIIIVLSDDPTTMDISDAFEIY